MVFHHADTLLTYSCYVLQQWLADSIVDTRCHTCPIREDVQAVFLDMVQEAASDIQVIDFGAVVRYLTTGVLLHPGYKNAGCCIPADIAFIEGGVSLAASVAESRKCVSADFIMRLFIILLNHDDVQLVLKRVSNVCRQRASVYQVLLKRVEDINALASFAPKTCLEEQFCLTVRNVRVQVLRLIDAHIVARDMESFTATSRLALGACIFDIQCLYTLLFKYAESEKDMSRYVDVLLSFKSFALPSITPTCTSLLCLIEAEMKYRLDLST